MGLVVNLRRALSYVERQYPPGPDAEEQIEALSLIPASGIKVEIPPALGKSLCKFCPDIEIDTFIGAEQLVAYKFIQSKAVSEPVVTFFIFGRELSDAPYRVILNPYFVLKKACAERYPDARSRIDFRKGNELADQAADVKASFPQLNISINPVVTDNKTLGGAHIGQYVDLDVAPEYHSGFQSEYPIGLVGDEIQTYADVVIIAEAVAQIPSRKLGGVAYVEEYPVPFIGRVILAAK